MPAFRASFAVVALLSAACVQSTPTAVLFNETATVNATAVYTTTYVNATGVYPTNHVNGTWTSTIQANATQTFNSTFPTPTASVIELYYNGTDYIPIVHESPSDLSAVYYNGTYFVPLNESASKNLYYGIDFIPISPDNSTLIWPVFYNGSHLVPLGPEYQGFTPSDVHYNGSAFVPSGSVNTSDSLYYPITHENITAELYDSTLFLPLIENNRTVNFTEVFYNSTYFLPASTDNSTDSQIFYNGTDFVRAALSSTVFASAVGALGTPNGSIVLLPAIGLLGSCMAILSLLL